MRDVRGELFGALEVCGMIGVLSKTTLKQFL